MKGRHENDIAVQVMRKPLPNEARREGLRAYRLVIQNFLHLDGRVLNRAPRHRKVLLIADLVQRCRRAQIALAEMYDSARIMDTNAMLGPEAR
jgi:hypothetical protein